MPKEDTQFKPGAAWTGNAGGRPKNTLKDHLRKKFKDMTDEERDEFLGKVSPEVKFKMAEGNPDSQTDVTSGGEPISLNVTFEDS